MAELGAVIDAAILAGGLGTRLRPTISDRPKVLAPVAQRPFLAYLLDQVAAAGVQRVVLCTGYLGEQLQATLGDRYGGLSLSYSHEPTPMGTAGALRLALPLLHSDPVLVLNGDSYCDAALRDFIAWYDARAVASAGALLLTWVDDVARYGAVEIDAAGNLVAFREKRDLTIPGWISSGAYLLSRRLLLSIPAERPVSLERDVFPAWVGRGLLTYQTKAPFVDIGTPESYAQAEDFFTQRSRHRLRVPEGTSAAEKP